MATAESLAADSPAKIKVVILEDGRYDLLGMTTELKEEPDIDVVRATAQPSDLMAAISEHHPAVAVIDLRIYDDDDAGLRVIREIKQAHLPVRIVVLTAFPDLSNFLAAFDLGAEAFTKKAAADPRPTLSQLIRLVASGARFYDPDLMQEMRQQMEHFLPAPANDAVLLPGAPLSEREREVLQLLASDATIQQVAIALCVSRNTVKTHIRNINSKLGARGRRDAILIGLAAGLLNPPSQRPASSSLLGPSPIRRSND